MFELATIALVSGIFLLAGSVKGVVGLGLPTVSLALLTISMDLKQAIALMLVPSLVTNFWQAVVGGNGRLIISRCWLFLTLATLCVGMGAMGLQRLSALTLTALLGGALVTYALLGLSGLKLTISANNARWVGPLAGIVNGILTGLTGSFVVPGVLYLQALGFSRDQLIQAMGILFTVSTLAVAAALSSARLLSVDLGLTSAIGLIPALIGMWAGQTVRHRLSEARFKQVFFVALLVVGAFLVFKGLR